MWDISSLSSSAPVTAYFRSTSLTSGWYLRNPIIARNWFKSVRSIFNSLITSPTDLLNSGEIVGGIDPLLNFNFKAFIFSSNWSNVKSSSLTFCNTTLQSSPVKKHFWVYLYFRCILILFSKLIFFVWSQFSISCDRQIRMSPPKSSSIKFCTMSVPVIFLQ